MRSGLPVIVLQIAHINYTEGTVLTNEVSNHGEQTSKGIVDDLISFCFSKRGSRCILVIISKARTVLELIVKRMGYFISGEGKRQSLRTAVNSLGYILASKIQRR